MSSRFDLVTSRTNSDEASTTASPSLEAIKAVAHMRIADAAQVLGIKEAKLRTLSRLVGFKRWPGRKLSSVIYQAKVCHMSVAVWLLCGLSR
jgi:RWP-RK domain